MARLPGGLRNADKVVRVATTVAAGDAIAGGHIEAAIEELKLVPKGGK